MKIAIVNTYYYPNMIGGTEHSVKILAEGLVKKGEEVFVITIDSLEGKIIKEEINGVKIYRLASKKFDIKCRINSNGNVLKKIKNKLVELNNKEIEDKLKEILKNIKPDIVHTNNLYGLSPRIWKLAKDSEAKVIHTVRDYWIVNPRGELPQKSNFLLKNYQKYFRDKTADVDFVTAPSKFTLNAVLDLKYFKKENSKCIYNSTNVNLKETEKYINKKKKNKSEIIKFLYVGGLFNIKGIYNLIDAFTNIENENIRLTICGDGDLKEYIIEKSNKDKRIIYKGKLDKNDLKKVYIENDVLIVPSIWDEPFGRVVIEGNQYGLPVIGSNKGGIKETLELIKTGEIYQFDNVEKLKEKINYFSERDNIKKYYNAILNSIDMYSIGNQIKEFSKLYNDLINKGEKS